MPIAKGVSKRNFDSSIDKYWSQRACNAIEEEMRQRMKDNPKAYFDTLGTLGADFDPAVKKVLIHEAGYADHPNDRGGPTNYGITKKTYENFVGRSVSKSEIKNMPKGNAIQIYKTMYWDKVMGDDIDSYPIAFAIFDQAVNRGISRAIRQAQDVLGVYQSGKMTRGLVERLNNVDEQAFIERYLDESEQAYKNIVSANPTQQVFLRGWLNRVNSLRNYTNKYLSASGIDWNKYALWGSTSLAAIALGYLALTMTERQPAGAS